MSKERWSDDDLLLALWMQVEEHDGVGGGYLYENGKPLCIVGHIQILVQNLRLTLDDNIRLMRLVCEMSNCDVTAELMSAGLMGMNDRVVRRWKQKKPDRAAWNYRMPLKEWIEGMLRDRG